MLTSPIEIGESVVAKHCRIEYRAEGEMCRARASEIFKGVPFHLQLNTNLHI